MRKWFWMVALCAPAAVAQPHECMSGLRSDWDCRGLDMSGVQLSDADLSNVDWSRGESDGRRTQ